MAVIDYRTAKIADKVTALFQDDQLIRETLLDVAKELFKSLSSSSHVW